MRVHYLLHAPFEGPGSIALWAQSQAHTESCSKLFAGEALPPTEAFDLLVVMGGPMGVYQEQRFPWLAAEKIFLANCLEQAKPVLGICLGAQLIAAALGAPVYQNRYKEIGWWPVEKTAAASASRFGSLFPQELKAFHWHGDTFDLPPGATQLLRSTACENQAFEYGDTALGLQFHLETTPASLRALVKNCPKDLVAAPFVQGKEQLNISKKDFGAINDVMKRCLEKLIKET